MPNSDDLLIKRVQEATILYNTRCADFRLSHKKEKVWQEVAESLEITVQDAKRRWTCLRDRYARELRQQAKFPNKDDCGRNEHFRSMDFLRPFVKKRQVRQSPWERGSYEKKSTIKLLKVPGDNNDTDAQSYEEGSQDQYDNKLNNSGAEEEYNFVACELDQIESYGEYASEQQTIPTEASINEAQEKNVKGGILPIVLSHMQPGDMVNAAATLQAQAQLQHVPETKMPSQQQETEDDFFCKSVAIYLRKLSRRHKIKAKVEMFQILEKYIEIEENEAEQQKR